MMSKISELKTYPFHGCTKQIEGLPELRKLLHRRQVLLKWRKLAELDIKIAEQGEQMVPKHQINLISELKPIIFDNLQRLSLSSCQIDSIQGICQIALPKLDQLYINHNQITVISQLKKSNFPAFCHLDLHSNQILDGYCLTKCNFQNFQSLIIEHDNDKKLVDLRFLFKLKTDQLNELHISQSRLGYKAIILTQQKKQAKEPIFS